MPGLLDHLSQARYVPVKIERTYNSLGDCPDKFNSTIYELQRTLYSAHSVRNLDM